MSNCVLCGKSARVPSSGCSRNRGGNHCVPEPGTGNCAWCGTRASYGVACTKAFEGRNGRYHAIVMPGKCTYCGSGIGASCNYSPSGKHHFGNI